MYYIYHIRGIKFGCTNNPKKREKQMRKHYGDNISFQIVEEFADIEKAGDAEYNHNKTYGYVSSDRKHYKEMLSMREDITYHYGKNHHNYGIDLSGDKNPNYGNKWTDEQKKILSQKNSNPSTKTRSKMSEAWKNKEKLECPHCGKIMNISHAKRYHFNNCKNKEKV